MARHDLVHLSDKAVPGQLHSLFMKLNDSYMTSCRSSLCSLGVSLWTFPLCAFVRKLTWFMTLSSGGRGETPRSSSNCFSAVCGVAQAGRRGIQVQASLCCSDGKAPWNSVKGGTSSIEGQPNWGCSFLSSIAATSAATNFMLETMWRKLGSCKSSCWNKHVTSVLDLSCIIGSLNRVVASEAKSSVNSINCCCVTVCFKPICRSIGSQWDNLYSSGGKSLRGSIALNTAFSGS